MRQQQDTASEPEVVLERKGEAAIIVLNRPKALNALNLTMVRVILPALRAWAKDPAVSRVIIKGAGEKAFCAGGDVRAAYELGRSGRRDEGLSFFREEYVLNHYIGTFPKPYVALIDGICMGGGVGLSAHGLHRVAGDRYLLAMPEMNIGLFPDVGATYVLPRLPGAFGVFLALTASRIGAADAYACGLATAVVPSASFAALEAALCDGGDVAATIAAHHVPPGPGDLADRIGMIADLFSRSSVDAIVAAVAEAAGGGGPFADFAASILRKLEAASPTSSLIAMEQMKRGPALDLGECLKIECRLVTRVMEGHDFYEGVRAVLVDRDNAPRWQPARRADIDPATIAAYFAPLAHELELLAPGA